MKTKTKIMLFIISCILFIPTLVNASVSGTLVQEKVDDVWITRRGGTSSYFSAQFTEYSINGYAVYCIEAGVAITTENYIGEYGYVNSPYDDETTKLLELIAYYGYDYEDHQTLKFRMATQALIWETVSDQIVEFWTEASGYGDYIDVSEEKEIIMNLVNSHYEKPSFNLNSVELNVGDEYVFVDENKVLSQYEIYSSTGVTAEIIGNELHITATSIGDYEVQLIKKSYDTVSTIIFVGDDDTSQKMGLMRFSDPVVSTISVSTLGGSLEINKLDSYTNTNVPQYGDATLENAVYGIYNNSGTKISEITTDEFGSGKIENIFEIGTYYIQEIKSPTGYLLDETKYYFEITSSSEDIVITVYEDIITSKIEIVKVFATSDSEVMTPESSVQFGIYDSSNNLIMTTITDENGRLTFELPYGSYTVKQLTTTSNYEKVDDFQIFVNNDGETLYYVLSNAEITAKLKVIKIDYDTGEALEIAGIKFKIYDVLNEEYVCQTITYPSAMTICEYETDENGILITPYELSNGTYILEEVDQEIEGYLWNNETITFEIGDNSNFVIDDDYGVLYVLEYVNKEVKGQVEITKYGEELIVSDGTFYYEEISLEGVLFGLYANEDIYSSAGILQYNKDDLITTALTDENGLIIIDDLYLGKYYLIELETVDNFVLDTTVYEFELTYIDQYTSIVYYELEVQNYLIKNDLEFTKYDLFTEEVLPNALIEIYTLDDELIYSGYTDENGLIVVNDLFIGEYYLIEVEAPTGYVLTKDKVFFEIVGSEENIIVSMTNKPIESNLEFTKYDLETEEVLPNALIEIYTLDDELVYSGYTNEDGILLVDRLIYGEYYLIEIEAPTGYVLSDEKIYFSVTTEKELILLNMANELITGTLEFSKTDLVTGDPIPNTLIEIYNIDDELIYSGYTDENGLIIVENLVYGKYYIIEIEPSTDYIITDEIVYFEILENGEIVQASMTNEKVEIPSTELNEINYINIMGIIFISIGVSCVIYKKIKKQ